MPLTSDAQYVLILDEDGEWLETLDWQSSDAQIWIHKEYDLMHYAGRTIQLYFGVFNDGEGCAMAMYVDDVSLEVCYGGVPTCEELVINGGFEVDEAWWFPVTAYTAGYSTDRAHSGNHSMRLGIVDWSESVYSYSSGSQKVTIPSEAAP